MKKKLGAAATLAIAGVLLAPSNAQALTIGADCRGTKGILCVMSYSSAGVATKYNHWSGNSDDWGYFRGRADWFRNQGTTGLCVRVFHGVNTTGGTAFTLRKNEAVQRYDTGSSHRWVKC